MSPAARRRVAAPPASGSPLTDEFLRGGTKACVDALEPDLVILGEFQRFKTLSDPSGSDTAVELAQSMFGARTPEGRRVRMLLLSATPYKLYTADAEIGREDHYEDFIATTRFLFRQDEDRVGRLQRDIARFGTALKQAASSGPQDGLMAIRQRVQGRLRDVMARTERAGATDQGDSMVEEAAILATPTPSDVRQYLWADEVFRAVGDRDPMLLLEVRCVSPPVHARVSFQ